MLPDSCQDEPADHLACDDQRCGPPLDLIERICDHHRAVPINPVITPTQQAGDAATLRCPLNLLHAYMSGRGESPLSRHQPNLTSIFTPAGAPPITWPSRCYSCSFCGREFNSAQALGGHMNIHRRDRARLRTISRHSSNTSSPPRHDWPPSTASPDQNTPQHSEPLPNPQYSSTQFSLPFQASSGSEYCSQQDPTSSSNSLSTYNPSPIMHISGAPALKLATAMMSPAAQHDHQYYPFDYKNFSAPPSNPAISLARSGSSSHTSATANFAKLQTDSHSVDLLAEAPHDSSTLLTSPGMKIKPVPDGLNCGRGQAVRASQSPRLAVAGRSTGARYDYDEYAAQLIQFKEADVHLSKRRSQNIWRADAALSSEDPLIRSIQPPLQNWPSSVVGTKDADSPPALHGTATSPTNDSLACVDLELRLGQRSSSLSAAAPTSCSYRMQNSAARRPP